MESRDGVTLIPCPGLNHLFMTGEGKSTPGEHFAPGNVVQPVIADIPQWIKDLK